MHTTKKMTAMLALAATLLGAFGLAANASAEQPAGKGQAEDKRVLLTIPFEDREAMKREMRNNLEQLRRMVVAFAENDFETIAAVADEISLHKKRSQVVVRRGNADFTAMAVQFHGVLAPEIRKAAETKDPKRVASAMDTAMRACVACHERFKLTEWPDNKSYTRPDPIPLNLPEGAKILD